MPRFDECLEVVLRHEGGYSDHPADRGGETHFGISSAAHGPVASLTLAEARSIYRGYWEQVHAGALPAPLDLVAFDAAVNHGGPRALRMVQVAVGTLADGLWGPKTAAAAHACSPVGAARMVLVQRRALYARLVAADPRQQAFAKGWENRMRSLEREIGR
jgi:lysozyme family protein